MLNNKTFSTNLLSEYTNTNLYKLLNVTLNEAHKLTKKNLTYVLEVLWEELGDYYIMYYSELTKTNVWAHKGGLLASSRNILKSYENLTKAQIIEILSQFERRYKSLKPFVNVQYEQNLNDKDEGVYLTRSTSYPHTYKVSVTKPTKRVRLTEKFVSVEDITKCNIEEDKEYTTLDYQTPSLIKAVGEYNHQKKGLKGVKTTPKVFNV